MNININQYNILKSKKTLEASVHINTTSMQINETMKIMGYRRFRRGVL